MKSTPKQEQLEMVQLYDAYYLKMILWADTIVQDMDVAEDIVQELFIQIWEKGLYRELKNQHLQSYLYSAVRNKAIRILQQQKKIRYIPDLSIIENAWENTEHTHEEIEKKIEEELSKLSPKSREILECVHLKNMKYAEVADYMGISVSTVKTSLVRCMKALRSKINGNILLGFFFLKKLFKAKK